MGVDGGATKTMVVIENEAGHVLGEAQGGPANIRLSVKAAWKTIHDTLNLAWQQIGFRGQAHFHVGMGLAGCEVREAYQAFINHPHPFITFMVSSDSHTACLGAHAGQEGAVLIAGTGVVGFQLQAGQQKKVGGWGFPHDDEGGGAWLGLKAVQQTLKWLDGRAPASMLTKAIYTHFKGDLEQLVSWSNSANSTAFATLAPIVIAQAQSEDAVALSLLIEAANKVSAIWLALNAENLPCTLLGGITPFLQPHLHPKLKERLSPAKLSPERGAILLVRHNLAKANHG